MLTQVQVVGGNSAGMPGGGAAGYVADMLDPHSYQGSSGAPIKPSRQGSLIANSGAARITWVGEEI